MPTNDYHFITHWRVPGTVAEVTEILGDAPGLARWWPSVYLKVAVLAPGDEKGLGKTVDLYTKGWLPYTLRWQFEVTEVYADGFRLEATGDFVGRGIWTLVQEGSDVLVRYDWKIQAEKPLLRDFSFIMKPLFGANHRWAMAKGEASLKLELARWHARTEAERALVPPPATKVPVSAVVFGLLATAAVVWLVSRRRRG
jgi:hypothetical protein